MIGVLVNFLLQVWPNLAANVLWIPIVAVHHWLLRRHFKRELHKHLGHLR